MKFLTIALLLLTFGCASKSDLSTLELKIESQQRNIIKIQQSIIDLQNCDESCQNSKDIILSDNSLRISATMAQMIAGDIAVCYHLVANKFEKIEDEIQFLEFLNSDEQDYFSGKLYFTPRISASFSLVGIGVQQSEVNPVSIDIKKKQTNSNCLFELKVVKSSINRSKFNPKKYTYPCHFEQRWICITE